MPTTPPLEGRTLRYELAPVAPPGCLTVGMVAAALFWNGMSALSLVHAVSRFRQGHPDWVLNVLLVPAILIGLGFVVASIRSIMVLAGLGPTRVEIGAHPLQPGEAVDLLVTQEGRYIQALNALTVVLVCEEQVTKRTLHGSQTDTRTLGETPVFAAEALELRPGEPFEAPCRLAVPADARSSQTGHTHAIVWKVVVRGDVPRWPNFAREFPVEVQPTPPGAGRF